MASICLSLSSSLKVGWVPALLWIGGLGCVLWWALPLKRVRLVEGDFLISNGVREIGVPTTTLRDLEENDEERPPSISLYFDPPTAFGRVVRILPSTAVWKSEIFDQAAGVLREIALANVAGVKEAQVRRRIQETAVAIAGILANPSLDRAAEVTALSEEHLNELIERLPAYSTLRDFSLRERQRRWYG